MLASRAYERDYLDTAAVLERYTPERLISFAALLDPDTAPPRELRVRRPHRVPEVPLHVEYSLTELGHSANVPLAHLRNWALDNITRVLNLNPVLKNPLPRKRVLAGGGGGIRVGWCLR